MEHKLFFSKYLARTASYIFHNNSDGEIYFGFVRKIPKGGAYLGMLVVIPVPQEQRNVFMVNGQILEVLEVWRRHILKKLLQNLMMKQL